MGLQGLGLDLELNLEDKGMDKGIAVVDTVALDMKSDMELESDTDMESDMESESDTDTDFHMDTQPDSHSHQQGFLLHSHLNLVVV
ncbi:hypothetical protein BSLG_009301 [Batrachochytrium salamandrivorans]|nr:hypothetical protein BSLG_009301 [Batrachochytrium salamandrivorans]